MAALSLVAVLCAGSLRTLDTDASWTQRERALASFNAAKINSVAPLTCEDKRILELGLLNNQMRVRWSRPAGMDGRDLEYLVTIKETGKAAVTVSTENLSCTYQASGSLLGLAATLTIVPRLKGSTWTGPAVEQHGLAVSLLGLGVIVQCTQP